MATLYITEYRRMARDLEGRLLPASNLSEVTATQAVSIGGASTQSSAFNADTRWIEIHPDATCSIAVGKNPTATTGAQRMKADERIYAAVQPGQFIAVITNT